MADAVLSDIFCECVDYMGTKRATFIFMLQSASRVNNVKLNVPPMVETLIYLSFSAQNISFVRDFESKSV